VLEFLRAPTLDLDKLELSITLPQVEYSQVRAGKTLCDSRYVTPEGMFNLGSETQTSSSRFSTPKCVGRVGKVGLIPLNTEGVNLLKVSGANEIRRYVALLISSKAASFTLTKGPKSGQTIAIPLDGLRGALQTATCSAVSYLPDR
jgi:hypothetical protein